MKKQTTNLEKQVLAEDPPRHSSTLVASPEQGGMEVANDNAKASVTDEYPHGARLAAVVLSLMLGMFLIALDNVSPPVS